MKVHMRGFALGVSACGIGREGSWDPAGVTCQRCKRTEPYKRMRRQLRKRVARTKGHE